MHDVHNTVYILSKAGPNDRSPSTVSLLSRDKVPTTTYNQDPLQPPHTAPSPTSHWTIFVKMGSFNEKSDEKHDQIFLDIRQADTGAQLDASLHAQLDPNEALQIR